MTSRRKRQKKTMLLMGVGLAISLLMQAALRRPVGVFVADLLFTVGSVFLLAGLWGVVKNMGAFHSLKYGTRNLVRMLRGRRDTPKDKMLGGFLEYVQAQPRDPHAPWLTAIAFLFILLSVTVSFLVF